MVIKFKPGDRVRCKYPGYDNFYIGTVLNPATNERNDICTRFDNFDYMSSTDLHCVPIEYCELILEFNKVKLYRKSKW